MAAATGTKGFTGCGCRGTTTIAGDSGFRGIMCAVAAGTRNMPGGISAITAFGSRETGGKRHSRHKSDLWACARGGDELPQGRTPALKRYRVTENQARP